MDWLAICKFGYVGYVFCYAVINGNKMMTLQQWHLTVQNIKNNCCTKVEHKDIAFEIIKNSTFAFPEINSERDCTVFTWRENKIYLDMRIFTNGNFDWLFEDNRGKNTILFSDVSKTISPKFWECLQELNDLIAN